MVSAHLNGVIEQIRDRLVAACSPHKIILFGSQAYGDTTTDSDVDLLLVQDTDLSPLRRSLRAREAIGDIDVPVDLFVLTPDEFEETKDVIGGIAYAPAKYGRVIYEKP